VIWDGRNIGSVSTIAPARDAPVLVCGLGHFGYRAAELLLRLGERVVVVSLGAREEWRRDVEALGATVVLGDARDGRVLERAALAEAKAVLALTDADLVNIEIALDVAGAIVKTNSPYVEGSKVTLLEMDFSQLLANQTLLEQVAEPDSIEEAKKMLQGVKGFKVNLDREVTVEFR
jgi:Trk K+ transport system NAD-binding subunit